MSGALAAAIVALVACEMLGPVPRPAGDVYGRQVSPDGRWVVQSYLDGDCDVGWATVEARDGGVQRIIYYGEPANASWHDGDVVVTEQESGNEHVIDPRHGIWDDRVDDPVNFYGTIGGWAIPIVLIVLFDRWLVKRWLRSLGVTSAAVEQPGDPGSS